MNPTAERMHDPALLPPRPRREKPFRPGAILSGHFTMDDRYHVYRSRGTTSWLLFCTVRGTGFFRSEGGDVAYAGPGELHVYEPGVPQEYGTYPGHGWNFHWVRFTARPAWAVWLRWPRLRPGWGLRRLRTDSGALRRQFGAEFDRLHRDLRLEAASRTELAMNTLERILILATERLRADARQAMDHRVLRALEAIAARPEARFRVADLAREAHLSPSRFAHLFRRETGHAVINAVLQTRMREAARLLALTRLPVSEIAFTVGFSSPFYFSRTFSRHHRMSPRAFRQRHGGGADSG